MEWYTWVAAVAVVALVLSWLLRGKRANFKGKTALITGATWGIGLDFARCAVADGLNVVLVARDAARLEHVKKELESSNADVLVSVVAADLSKPGAGADLHQAMQRKGTVVDVVINNAGFGMQGAFIDVALDTHQRMMQLNMCTLTELTHLFARDMASRRCGRVLNVSSTAGFQPGPTMAVYYASKAYVTSMSQAVDFELRGTGVRVCTLCPGPVATLFGGKAGNDRTVLFKLLPVATAKSTAAYGWDGMLRGQRTMVHGWLNWMLALFGGITPTWLMLPMSRMMLRPV